MTDEVQEPLGAAVLPAEARPPARTRLAAAEGTGPASQLKRLEQHRNPLFVAAWEATCPGLSADAVHELTGARIAPATITNWLGGPGGRGAGGGERNAAELTRGKKSIAKVVGDNDVVIGECLLAGSSSLREIRGVMNDTLADKYHVLTRELAGEPILAVR